MLKLTILVLALVAVSQARLVAIYDKCGGNGQDWSDVECEDGSKCIFENEWYSQCRPDPAFTPGPPQPAKPINPANLILGDSLGLNAKQWPFGKFSFGRGFDINLNDYTGWSHSSIWYGYDEDWDDGWQGKWCRAMKTLNKQALIYGYVIAFSARKATGMHDCDMSSYNLCTDGANYIRDNRDKLVRLYTDYAAKTAAAMGADASPIWMIEPDFWQYYGDHKQKGGPLSGEYMRALYDDFAAGIRKHLPNAKFSFDISAWIGEIGMRAWWGYFKSASYIEFVNTSGGQGTAQAQIKPNELSYKKIREITGKPIIADCGYGVGGGPSSNCHQWNDDNALTARIADGVVALTQANIGFIPTY